MTKTPDSYITGKITTPIKIRTQIDITSTRLKFSVRSVKCPVSIVGPIRSDQTVYCRSVRSAYITKVVMTITGVHITTKQKGITPILLHGDKVQLCRGSGVLVVYSLKWGISRCILDN